MATDSTGLSSRVLRSLFPCCNRPSRYHSRHASNSHTRHGACSSAAVLLAGCGGSNNNGNGGSATASSSSRAKAGLKMAQCMRANGIPSFPDPSSSGGPAGGFSIQGGSNGTVTIGGATVAQSTLRAAFQKCRKELPQGPPISSAQLAKLRQGALKMAECMRAHGVDELP